MLSYQPKTRIFRRRQSSRRVIHPHASRAGNRHYFVEFFEQEAVHYACTLNFRNLRVSSLTAAPDLIEKYDAIISSTRDLSSNHAASSRRIPGSDASMAHVRSTVSQRDTRLNGVAQGHPTSEATTHSKFTSGPPNIRSPVPKPLPSPALTPSVPLLSPLKPSCLPVSGRPPLNDCEPAKAGQALTVEPPSCISSSSNPISTGLPTPISPARPLPDESGALFSVESRMVTSLCGEKIIFDLKKLDEDPEAIVKLLKVTSSERGNWMLAGCHYRRKGNVVAAVNIISTMLEGESLYGLKTSHLTARVSNSHEKTWRLRKRPQTCPSHVI
jgi:hypothetical protein